MWLSITAYRHRYIYSFHSCQRLKVVTQRPFGTLQPLPISAGPWTDISYDFMTRFPLYFQFDSILTVIHQLIEIAHFIECTETMGAKQLANPMLKHLWKLRSTQKTIFDNQGSVFILQITNGVDKHLVSDYTCLQLIIWGRTDNQKFLKNLSNSMYSTSFYLVLPRWMCNPNSNG